MDNKKIFLTTLIVILVIAGTVVAADNILFEEQVNRFESNVTVVEDNESLDLGVDAGSNLKFGQVVSGNNVTKFVNMSSEGDKIVTVNSKGNISDYIVHPDSMRFSGSERLSFEFVSEEPGYYQGEIVIKTVVPKSGMGSAWLNVKSKLM